MSALLWTPDGAGFNATRGRRTLSVALVGSEWVATGPAGFLGAHPSAEEAKIAAERSLPKRGRPLKPDRLVRFVIFVEPGLLDRIKAEAAAIGRSPSELVAECAAARWSSG